LQRFLSPQRGAVPFVQATRKNYKYLQMYPSDFEQYLLHTVGFSSVSVHKLPNVPLARPIHCFVK
jgi:hypothetical protein